MTPPADEPDLLAQLLRRGYGCPPPTEHFVQTLALRLDQELAPVRPRRSRRRWRLGALAAMVLLGLTVTLLALRSPVAPSPPTQPAVIGKDRPDTGRVPDTLRLAR